MQVLDNINSLFGDDLKEKFTSGSKVQIAAANFSIFAYEALKSELQKVDSFEFIYTSPTFTSGQQSEDNKQAHREFEIPKRNREQSLNGTEFEVHLKNKLTQRAIARECAPTAPRT